MTTPIPRDIPLPLPAPEGFLEILLIVSFLIHILFVHLMVGGSLFSLVCQIRGLKSPDYEKLAYRIMQTVTVNKSLAVVMGVAPLLVINTLYAPQFYASSALIGDMWMAVIPLVTVAFLLAYAHKFWWNHFINIPELHIGIAALETGLFLFIPLIFMTNVNLMLFPEYWPQVKGFFSAMLLPNVLQRYLHFISATILFSSLFFVWWSGRKSFQDEVGFSRLRVISVRRFFYAFAFGATVFQILTGLVVFASLPPQGMSWGFTLLLMLGGLLVLPAMWWMWQNLTYPSHLLDDRVKEITTCFVCAAIIMGIARHDYRENALADHKSAIAEKTANYQAAVKDAGEQAQLTAITQESQTLVPGESAFNLNCAACHHPTLTTVGPALQEIKEIYANNPAGIAAWTKAPGKKRPDTMKMPGFSQLSDDELTAISQYLLSH
ncbi:cytochrome c [Methylobacter sp. S3L5C]|uniref:c-type cytochrome n=1 Tax=Methylobacter sp. S3L5C TaxID=2839024 RepID=UPI001FABDFCE|nr:cytochrome c [Methylobacter sp. S3L5C]UOA08290.1 cytochrome c [Methylobacter sp. S3L5C]